MSRVRAFAVVAGIVLAVGALTPPASAVPPPPGVWVSPAGPYDSYGVASRGAPAAGLTFAPVG